MGGDSGNRPLTAEPRLASPWQPPERDPAAPGERPRWRQSPSGRLHADSERIWRGLHAHPFLRELAAGTLPLAKFRFFLEQDILYLADFARCLALGAAKSATEAELRYFATQLDAAINLELPNQRRVLDQVCQLGAPDRGGARGMAPANVAYTSFLLRVASQGGPLDIVAAILPCAWSYLEIAGRLAGHLAEHPVYREWVGFYLTDDVTALVREMREDFDEMARRGADSEGRRRELAGIFAMSSRLEGGFWQMAYTLDQWPDLRPGAAEGREPSGPASLAMATEHALTWASLTARERRGYDSGIWCTKYQISASQLSASRGGPSGAT
jgi:thiaminase (transcriptional activator TenA)